MIQRTTDRSFRHAVAGAIAAVALAMLTLACGSGDSGTPASEEPAAEAPAAPTPAETPSASATETMDELAGVEPILGDDTVPEGFPSDIPLYPGATPGASMVVPGDGLFATFESDDDVASVLDHYRSGFEENGWSIDDESDDGISATKDGRSVQIKARASETGATEIAVNLSEG